MWTALDLAGSLVRPGGTLFIAIYNDQGRWSRYWSAVKRTYCRLPGLLRPHIVVPAGAWFWGPSLLRDLLVLRPFESWRSYSRNRGMSPWRDVMLKLRTAGGSIGNNEFVFEKGARGAQETATGPRA
jgi:2-polyprenyl-6-hydroxyphenyl methylase/3-demethylubiquinone-9 3-methyltransferase